VCALSVSAEAAAPQLVAEGAANVQVGDKYTVNIRLNDAGKIVGGFQGELKFSGATFDSAVVNPDVLAYNNTEDAATVIKADENSVNFATVANLNGKNPATRIWFKVTFKITGDAKFTFDNVVFSDKNATEIDGTFVNLDPTVPAAGATKITLNKQGIREGSTPAAQGIVVNAGIDAVTNAVTEFGVVFYPTSLLKGEELTVATKGAVIASVTKGDENFANFVAAKNFNAVLNFNFSSDENAAKFLGTKVSARVFYKTADGVFYSANSVGKYIQGGVSSKAVLNTVLDYAGDGITPNNSDVTTDAYVAAKAGLNTSNENWNANRCTVLKYAVQNATFGK
jgi:hypothetical protein